jgi:lysine-specific demethylase/histidyl-hydroxylase NO66
MTPTTFDAYIAPITREHFLAQYLGKEVLYCPGADGRLSDLITTADIEELLSRLVVYPGMMRVKAAAGRDLPATEYLTRPISRATDARLVDGAALERHLRSGATLIMDNCQGLFSRIHAACNVLADAFGSRVAATLFVVLVPDAPQPLHADDHDVFVCQVVGHKRWPVFRCDNSGVRPEMHTTTPAWEGILEPNDALYVPRGWPHQPSATVTPSVHVTFDIVAPTGMDLLAGLIDHVMQEAFVRANLPVTSSTGRRQSYNTELREIVLHAMADDAINTFVSAQRLAAVSRPFRLTR